VLAGDRSTFTPSKSCKRFSSLTMSRNPLCRNPRRKCCELASRFAHNAKKRGHCRHVGFVLRALPHVGAAGFRTDEGLRRPPALGFVCHVQTMALNLLVQMPSH